MREKLAPFDFDAFKSDPARLRSSGGSKPFRAGEALGDSVAVVWCTGDPGTVYLPHEFRVLRLAAKTRIVRVRLFRNNDGDVFARTSDGVELDQADYVGNSWVSEIIVVEVEA